MSSKAAKLGASASFSHAAPAVSARRAAIAAATEAPTSTTTPAAPKVPLKLISENPKNPREELGDVSHLAQSMLEVGLVNAITLVTVDAYLAERPDHLGKLKEGARYVVVDGHRRFAAAHEAGLQEIKYTVDDAFATSDEKLLEAAFVANVHRENMAELEEANALNRLVTFYGSQRKAAQRLGISQAFISQRLSLLHLDPALQAELEAGERKVEHVRGLSKLPPQQQRAEADRRAAEASEKAQQRKLQVAEAAPQKRPGSDNAVITQGPEGPAVASDNGVIAEPEASEQGHREVASSPDHGDRLPASPPSMQENPRPEQKPSSASSDLPWHDVDEMASLICQHMDAGHIKRLTRKLWAVHPD
ncbi:ParB/RepB/Spo0J family partition protein [Streptomyces sp. 769]|uniref:ParB/RepB/Spo0J family partition protein n=1 Tax=Streptomyces sp. 769 TaxID=1262452 RepID=UPI000581C2E6|nr:ParB/RepB/Spo0J family partition protein [Streptomyces sp. 769]AJC62002.1 putative plasmid partitioning protein, parb2 [Streptomyces sp. 769]